MSYVAGGFPMVIAARNAIEKGVGGLADDAMSARTGVKELENLAANQSRPGLRRLRRQGASRGARYTSKTQTALRDAQAILPVYSEYFRRAWNAIAAYEEVLLRQYDRELQAAFKEVAAQNRKLAEDEWTKYAPLGESKDPLPFGTTEADQVRKLALNAALIDKLGQATDPKGEKKEKDDATAANENRDRALDEMWKRALELYRRAKARRANREAGADLAAKEDKKQADYRAKRANDDLIAWNKYRKEIADDFPILLKIYPHFKSVADADRSARRSRKRSPRR